MSQAAMDEAIWAEAMAECNCISSQSHAVGCPFNHSSGRMGLPHGHQIDTRAERLDPHVGLKLPRVEAAREVNREQSLASILLKNTKNPNPRRSW